MRGSTQMKSARRPIPPPSMPAVSDLGAGNRLVRPRHWPDAAHAHHRSRQRRQGGRRAGAPPRRAAARAAARRADVGGRRALPARARRRRDRLRRRGGHLRAAWSREIARRAGRPRRGRSARSRATASSRAAVREARAARAGAARRPRRASPSAAGALFAELQRSLVTPARFTARCATGRPPAGAPAHAEELAALYSAYRRRLERLGAPDAEGYAWAALDALRAAPAAWGGAAGVPLRLRRPDADAARRGRDARRATRADVCVALPYEPGRAAFAGPRGDGRGAAAAGAEAVELPDRSEHYAPGARGRAAPPRAPAVRGRAPRARAERRGAAAGGRRRARRGRAGRRRGARADARGRRAGGHRGARCAATPAPRCSRRCSRATASPSSPTGACRWRARGSAPACSRPRARLPGGTRRRPADLAAHARQARRPGRRRRAGGCTSAAPRSRRRAEARACGSARSAAGARPRSTRRPRSRPRSLDALVAEAEAIWTAPHRARGRGARARGRSPTRGSPRALRAAAAELRGARRRRPRAASAAERRDRGARPRAGARAARVDAARRAARRPARDPRAPLPRGVRVRAAGRRVPAPPRARAVPRRRRPRARSRAPPGSCCRRTRTCSPRALPASTPRCRGPRTCCSSRGARPTRRATRLQPSAVPRRRAGAVHRRAVGAARPRGCSPTSPGRRATRRRRTSCAAPTPRPREAQAGAAAARRARDRAACWRPSPRARPSRRAGWRRSPACGVRWLVEQLLRPARTEPDPEPMRRGSLAHAVLERTLRAPARAHRLGRDSRPRALDAALAALRDALARARRPRPARGAARCCAGSRPTCERYLRDEAECGAGFEPELRWSGASAAEDAHGRSRSARAPARSPAASTASTSARRRARSCATTRAARRVGRREAGRTTGSCRCALYLLAVRELLGLRAGRRRSTSRSAGATLRAARARPRRRARRYVTDDVRRRRGVRRARSRSAREPRARRGAPTCAPAGSAPCPERCSPQAAARYPGDLPRAARRPRDGARRRAAHRTAVHARAARGDRRPRTGSSLLAADAGSGKTAVMVERFVEAVLDDGVPVGAILALTFTEKAAGELRERIRRRFAELGEDEHARAVDGAWIGTIHGFCARVLRAQPLAAGLDPRFAVLDEPAAAAARRGRVRARAGGVGGARAAPRRSTSRPRTACELRDDRRRRARHAAQPRRRRIRGCRSRRRGRRPTPRRCAARRAMRAPRALGERRRRHARRRGRAARSRRASGCSPAGGGAAAPGALDAGQARRAARKALEDRRLRRLPRGLGRRTAAPAPTTTRAPRSILLDDLLDALRRARTPRPRRRAPASTSTTSSCACATCSRDPAMRARWAERFALIMVDEFQDTNRLQLDVLEALERDNLFAVGDESQSIYGFRHADVAHLPRAARARSARERVRRPRAQLPLGRGAARRAQRRVRGRCSASGFTPLVAGRGRAARPLRLFDPDPPAATPPRRAAGHRHRAAGTSARAELGLGGARRRSRGGAPRRALVAHRLREEVDAGRRPGDVVVLVRATALAAALEQALEEQGLPTYVVGGRGYWSQEQVRDGARLPRRARQPARRGRRSTRRSPSPFCGVGHRRAGAARRRRPRGGGGAWAALRRAAPAPTWPARCPPRERARLRRASRASPPASARGPSGCRSRCCSSARSPRTGYDLAILARAGGERRLANLRKLMRLAREYERAEGRDLRGFLAYAADAGPRRGARGRGGARVRGARRRAADDDPPRQGARVPGRLRRRPRPPGAAARDAAADRRATARVGLRLAPLGGGEPVPALGYERLADAARRGRGRGGAAAALRRDDARARAADPLRRHRPRALARAAPGRAAARLDRAARCSATRGARSRRPRRVVERALRRPAGAAALRAERAGDARRRAAARRARAGAAARAPARRHRAARAPTVLPRRAARPRPAPQRLSYSLAAATTRAAATASTSQRVLGLPRGRRRRRAADAGGAARRPRRALERRALRGTLVHALLEGSTSRARPRPTRRAVARARRARTGVELDRRRGRGRPRARRRLRGAPRCARGWPRRAARPPRGRRSRSRSSPAAAAPLVTGFVDVLAREPDGGVLIVDYKTDRLEGAEPAELVERDYATQRLVYALAALRDGAPRVEVAYCFLERPGEPVIARVHAPPTRRRSPSACRRSPRGVLAER